MVIAEILTGLSGIMTALEILKSLKKSRARTASFQRLPIFRQL